MLKPTTLFSLAALAMLCLMAVTSTSSEMASERQSLSMALNAGQLTTIQALKSDLKYRKLPVVDQMEQIQRDFIEQIMQQAEQDMEADSEDLSGERQWMENREYFSAPVVTYGDSLNPEHYEFGSLLLDYSLLIDGKRWKVRVNADGEVDIQESGLSDLNRETICNAIEEQLAENEVWSAFLASLEGKCLDWSDMDGTPIIPPGSTDDPSQLQNAFPHKLLQDSGALLLRQYVRDLVCDSLEARGYMFSDRNVTPSTAI